MRLTTGKKFDILTLDPYPDYHGLVVEFDPNGNNAVVGNSLDVIKLELGFITLPSGKVGLSVNLPPDNTYKVGTLFVLIEDTMGAKKITLDNGLELERVK